MNRLYVSYFIIGIVTIFSFGVVLERMQIPVPTVTELRDAYQYGQTNDKPTPPQPFRFDGCTLFPDQILGTSFRQACLQHDIAYWYGGSAMERLTADQAFKQAIQAEGFVGRLFQQPIYWSVRLFGDTILLRPLNANWGFGYNETK
jgi:hypothetical protein